MHKLSRFLILALAVVLLLSAAPAHALYNTELFADVPGVGTALRALNGIDTGYRYMVSGNWMVFLGCDNGRALVVRVLYAKSDYMRTLFGEVDNER